MHNVADLDAALPTSLPLPIPHSDWFISEAPGQIMPLINQNDASIPTDFFPFSSNFRGLMRNPGENRSPIKAEELFSEERGLELLQRTLPPRFCSVTHLRNGCHHRELLRTNRSRTWAMRSPGSYSSPPQSTWPPAPAFLSLPPSLQLQPRLTAGDEIEILISNTYTKEA